MTIRPHVRSRSEESQTARFGRLITRRRLFRNAMRGGLVIGGAMAAPLGFFEGRAEAAGCSYYGQRSNWGCFCNPNQKHCGSTRCTSSGGCASAVRKRCTYWTVPEASGNYCWCSLSCYQGDLYGYYTCCDCWIGGSGSCGVAGGGEQCLCRDFKCIANCA